MKVLESYFKSDFALRKAQELLPERFIIEAL